jgi:hypothetical protein
MRLVRDPAPEGHRSCIARRKIQAPVVQLELGGIFSPPFRHYLHSIVYSRHEISATQCTWLTAEMKFLPAVIAALAACSASVSADVATAEYHRYIIVGAGPGGLQLGHYMDTAGRDYLILDKVRSDRVSMRRSCWCAWPVGRSSPEFFAKVLHGADASFRPFISPCRCPFLVASLRTTHASVS